MAKLRLILFPFSILYIFVTEIRNLLFRINVLKSQQYTTPIINVGNLSVGGTGKTPMVLWLMGLLSESKLNIAIISRGYGRKSKGFSWVDIDSTPENVGDEPLLFKQAFPNSIVAVCEKRTEAADKILYEKKVDVIILDDAYQHQYIKPSFNILLSDYSRPFYTDFVLPAGNLRELRKNKNRANLIITTKCPENLSKDQERSILSKMGISKGQKALFSKIKYNALIPILGGESLELSTLKNKQITLVTGIAHADKIKLELEKWSDNIHHYNFSDHHNYTKTEVERITQKQGEIIITTSKDAVKLRQFNQLRNVAIYVLTISTYFTDNEQISQLILNHVKGDK